MKAAFEITDVSAEPVWSIFNSSSPMTMALTAALLFGLFVSLVFFRRQARAESSLQSEGSQAPRSKDEVLALIDHSGRVLGGSGLFFASTNLPLEQVIGKTIWSLDDAGFGPSFWKAAIGEAREKGTWQIDRFSIGERKSPLSLPHLVTEGAKGSVIRISLQANFSDNILKKLRKTEGRGALAPADFMDGAMLLHIRTKRPRSEIVPGAQGVTDRLTGVLNRRGMKSHVETAILQAETTGRRMSVVMFDLDRFADINAVFGDMVGDRVLVSCAKVISRMAISPMQAARTGGDEFALLMPDTDRDEAARFAKLVLDELGREKDIQGIRLRPSASAGVASFPRDAENHRRLMQSASQALAAAKEGGRGHVVCCSENHRARNKESLGLELELRRGLRKGELMLYYQPLIDLPTGHCVGAEALLRWQHPERGVLLPGDFVPMALDVGLTAAIDQFVLKRVCRQIHNWQQLNLPLLPVSVNLSLSTLLAPEFPNVLRKCMNRWNVPRDILQIEVTETVHFPRLADAQWDLSALKRYGVSLALDDFGTGYSSVSMLKDLPVDRIKIDRRFVGRMTDDITDGFIVSSLVDLGRNLGLSVVAEGVESEPQKQRLIELGCSHAQGFLFAKPMSAHQFETGYLTRREPQSRSSPRKAMKL